jgi:hypothetical protein
LASFPASQLPEALAFVRDEDAWSVLAPAETGAREPIGVFVFHFPPGLDNSGFVGWLAVAPTAVAEVERLRTLRRHDG